ncbi:MAG: DsbA family protein [Xanthobacteraceae bacterium]|nr:DsbA family protein [Xanthobacteraceae bacterium]MCW5673825.1 DsbA family protein [Xanthobacteraceae bacterium]
MSVSRRQFNAGLSAAVLAAAATNFLPGAAFAQASKPVKKFTPADLFKAGALGDHVLGKADAPVTIVEYASFTCSHCANFHTTTFPKLKEKYIDTGKVKLIFRVFPTAPAELSIGAGMLAHCAGEEKYFAMASALFETQRTWMSTSDPLPALKKLANQAGITDEKFNQCLSDKNLAQEIQQTAVRGYEVFGVEGTPTFFINGTMVIDGEASIENFSKVIDPLLK